MATYYLNLPCSIGPLYAYTAYTMHIPIEADSAEEAREKIAELFATVGLGTGVTIDGDPLV
jgi:hypothetical protein